MPSPGMTAILYSRMAFSFQAAAAYSTHYAKNAHRRGHWLTENFATAPRQKLLLLMRNMVDGLQIVYLTAWRKLWLADAVRQNS
jgi:hypothetical protein